MLLSQKLLPIFVFPESYASISVNTTIDDPSLRRTVLTSLEERLSPDCPFTRFLGPEYTSPKIVTMSSGEEAIFAKYPNWVYKITHRVGSHGSHRVGSHGSHSAGSHGSHKGVASKYWRIALDVDTC